MKKLFPLFLLLVFACNSNKPITIAKLSSGTTLVGILTNGQKPDIISNALQISNSSIIGDSLFLDLEYSGGCNTHEFHAYKKKTEKDTVTLGIVHNGNGDACRAIISEKVWFDLSTLKTKKKNNLYIKMHRESFILNYTY
jgi:hypothetical protein